MNQDRIAKVEMNPVEFGVALRLCLPSQGGVPLTHRGGIGMVQVDQAPVRGDLADLQTIGMVHLALENLWLAIAGQLRTGL
jgi:hypothetical protein